MPTAVSAIVPPTEAGITAIAIAPGSVTFSPGTANGPIAGAPAGQDRSVGFTETIICNIVSTESEESAIKMKIVPNPNRGTFQIWSSEQIEVELHIFEATGRLCFSGKAQTNQDIMPGGLPVGVYVVRVTDSEGKAQSFQMIRE